MRRTVLFLAAAAAVAIGGPLAAAAIAATPAAAAAGPCGTVTTPPAYTHVIWIWMENHSFSDIIGNTAQAPYINSLASDCGLATNYHNISHPSLPNYIAGISRASTPTAARRRNAAHRHRASSARERPGRPTRNPCPPTATRPTPVSTPSGTTRRRTTPHSPGAPPSTSPT